MPWQITRYSCPGTVKIKLCPVSARFFSLFFPYPPPFTLPLSFSLPVPFFILLSAGKCASEEEVGARRELLPGLLLSPSYWGWVNGADGWRRAIKMEAFVPPPPLPRPGGRGSPPCSLTCKHLRCLPAAVAGPPPGCTPLLRTPEGPVLPTPRLPGSCTTSQPPPVPLSTVTGGLCSPCRRCLFPTGQGLMHWRTRARASAPVHKRSFLH